jgi:uncharacterized spore protein YtfJ
MTETDLNDQNEPFIERLATKLGTSATSKMIFHEPIKGDGVTIIPVGKIRYGFGGGFKNKQSSDTGTGGGGGMDVAPVGYIEIKDGHTEFKSIRPPISLPSIIIAGGFAGLFLFRGISKLFRK